jgi:coenzyme PQQ synthesis protein D (PqqD)
VAFALCPDTRVVASSRQLSTELAGEIVILGLDDGVYYGLEGVGTRVWELLQSPRCLTELVAALVLEYDTTTEQLAADLHAKGLVAVVPAAGA